jgi:hypothetical protein
MEDKPVLRADLVDEIRDRVPFVRIDEGDRIEDGLALIKYAAVRQKPYDAAILDFKLHSDHLDRDQVVDEQLCNEIRRTMHDCLVIHVTGHASDQPVVIHEERCHSGIRGPRSWKIAKEGDYVHETARIIQNWVSAKPVHDMLDRLFTTPKAYIGMGMHAHTVAASASQMLIQLEQWTSAHWDNLDLPTQTRLLCHFRRLENRLLLRQHPMPESEA